MTRCRFPNRLILGAGLWWLANMMAPWQAMAEEYDVIGDPETNVYLLPNCAGYEEMMALQMRRHFRSMWDAEDAGYARAADCHPLVGQKPGHSLSRMAATYLPPPSPREESGQNCLVLENLETKKSTDKDNRVILNWQTRVQNICSIKILSTMLFQAVNGNREKIFERPSLVEIGEDQILKFSEKVTMPVTLYESSARFQVAILWEEPVVRRAKRKPPVEEEDEDVVDVPGRR